MKKYIAPEFKVAMFYKEAVSTEEELVTISQLPLQDNTAAFMNGAASSAKVKKNIDFNKAIQFN